MDQKAQRLRACQQQHEQRLGQGGLARLLPEVGHQFAQFCAGAADGAGEGLLGRGHLEGAGAVAVELGDIGLDGLGEARLVPDDLVEGVQHLVHAPPVGFIGHTVQVAQVVLQRLALVLHAPYRDGGGGEMRQDALQPGGPFGELLG